MAIHNTAKHFTYQDIGSYIIILIAPTSTTNIANNFRNQDIGSNIITLIAILHQHFTMPHPYIRYRMNEIIYSLHTHITTFP